MCTATCHQVRSIQSTLARMIEYSFDSTQLARVLRQHTEGRPLFLSISIHSTFLYAYFGFDHNGLQDWIFPCLIDSIVAAVDSIIPASSALYIELAHARKKNTQLLPLRRTRKMADLYAKSRDESISREIDHLGKSRKFKLERKS